MFTISGTRLDVQRPPTSFISLHCHSNVAAKDFEVSGFLLYKFNYVLHESNKIDEDI